MDSNAVEFTATGINFVGRTFENNGIQGKIQKQDFEPNKPYTITATVIGNYKYVKYQTEEYYCSQNINKLIPKNIIKKWNKKIAQFIVTNIQKFVSLYDGQQGGYKLEDIKKHKIQLPVKCGLIDFEFMENFVAELEAGRVAKLEAYLLAAGLKDYNLTKDEESALKNYSGIDFGEFFVSKVFDIKNTSNILSCDITENSGIVPYLCASAENNSVRSYISFDERYKEKGNCVFIGGKTFVVTYQKNDFFSNDSHNLALYFKGAHADKLTQLFLATCVRKSLEHKYSWGNSVSKSKIKENSISLPVKDGEIDLSMVNLLISAIQKLVIRDVVLYADLKTEATNRVIDS